MGKSDVLYLALNIIDFIVSFYADILLTFFRAQSRTSRRITFDDSSQNLSISSMSEKSVEDLGMSLQVTCTLIESVGSLRRWCALIYSVHILQDILIEVYRSIGEPDSLYGCGGGKLINPLTRFDLIYHLTSYVHILLLLLTAFAFILTYFHFFYIFCFYQNQDV